MASDERRLRRAFARERLTRQRRLVAAAAVVAAVLLVGGLVVWLTRGTDTPAAVPTEAAEPSLPPPPPLPAITRPQWVDRMLVTQYYPVPESWFGGALVAAPGLRAKHAEDWLYSAQGVMMQGDGVDRTGKPVYVADTGGLGWVDETGARTNPLVAGLWSAGRPAWTTTGWRNAQNAPTHQLKAGGWSNGTGVTQLPLPAAVRFAVGASRPLTYWKSVAVDTASIPLGSRIFVPALCSTPARGWVTAADTGGAITGRHLDLYRPAPTVPFARVDTLREQKVFVVPKGAQTPAGAPRCP